MKTTFTTTVLKDEGSNATGLPVPAEAVAAMGKGKKPPVIVSIAGHTYRSTVAAYGDVFMLPLSAVHREGAGVKADCGRAQSQTIAAPRHLLATGLTSRA